MADMTIRDVRVTLARVPWPDDPMLAARQFSPHRDLLVVEVETQGGVIGILRRPFIDDARVRGQGQQPIAQFALEAVHHRKHHDQRGHAEGDAGERHPGDERYEESVLAGAHVAQTHKQ